MPVYVDDIFIPARVRNGARIIDDAWCHLTADSDDELHAMARRIGLRPGWAQHMENPNRWHRHYDVTRRKRAQAVAAGAIEITWRDAAKRSREETRRLRSLPAQPEQGQLL